MANAQSIDVEILGVSKCRSCGADILWAVTVNDKPQPFDAQPSEKGNNVLEPFTETRDGHVVAGVKARIADPLFDGARPRYMPHHATCKDAAKWRKS